MGFALKYEPISLQEAKDRHPDFSLMDKIVCVCSDSWGYATNTLKIGNIYTVHRIHYRDNNNKLELEELPGYRYMPGRFVRIKLTPKQSVDSALDKKYG